MNARLLTALRLVLVGGVAGFAFACGASKPADSTPPIKTEAVYDYYTGKLRELKADLDGDGKNDATAFMDGSALQRIEIDRNGDGKVDRWEYYNPGTTFVTTGVGSQFDRWAIIARAEESALGGGVILRRESYVNGVIGRVEDDVNADGKPDKWETYVAGTLAQVDLDLTGKGLPTRRLVYGRGGDVLRIERDDTGRGAFAAPAPAK